VRFTPFFKDRIEGCLLDSRHCDLVLPKGPEKDVKYPPSGVFQINLQNHLNEMIFHYFEL
jgi:hypothetical protein